MFIMMPALRSFVTGITNSILCTAIRYKYILFELNCMLNRVLYGGFEI